MKAEPRLPPLQSSTNLRRIVIIGGSNSVRKSGYLPFLKRHLESLGAPEIVNLAVGACSSAMGIGRLLEHGHLLEPGTVVIWEYALNDQGFCGYYKTQLKLDAIPLFVGILAQIYRLVRARSCGFVPLIFWREDSTRKRPGSLVMRQLVNAYRAFLTRAAIPWIEPNQYLADELCFGIEPKQHASLYDDPQHYQANSLISALIGRQVADAVVAAAGRVGRTVAADPHESKGVFSYSPATVVANGAHAPPKIFANSLMTFGYIEFGIGDKLTISPPPGMVLVSLDLMVADGVGQIEVAVSGSPSFRAALNGRGARNRSGLNLLSCPTYLNAVSDVLGKSVDVRYVSFDPRAGVEEFVDCTYHASAEVPAGECASIYFIGALFADKTFVTSVMATDPGDERDRSGRAETPSKTQDHVSIADLAESVRTRGAPWARILDNDQIIRILSRGLEILGESLTQNTDVPVRVAGFGKFHAAGSKAGRHSGRQLVLDPKIGRDD